MTRAEFQRICLAVVDKVKSKSPIDTGNLRWNAIRFEYVDERTFKIYVDQGIAPYMPYTNEPWIAERWEGKKNPNEAWWQRTIEEITKELTAELNGVMSIK